MKEISDRKPENAITEFRRLCKRLAVVAMGVCVVLVGTGSLAEAVSVTSQSSSVRETEVGRERILAESGFHGGLIVLIGVEDADLVLSAAKAPNVLVQALVRDRSRLEAIRSRIREAGSYGPVSAVYWNGPALPYADSMVNLLLMSDTHSAVTEMEMTRVLAPRGVAWIRRDDGWTSHCKPLPLDVDQWSHARYDATGNAVSRDSHVGPPRFVQWEAGPRWNRGVKTSVLVSSQGRIFYILDDSHFAVGSATWSLIARDAYNGILLWRHELPNWPGARGGKKVGPAQVHRRLVASGQRVYLAPRESEPIRVLDAATGKRIRSIPDTEGAEELILSDGVLVVLVDPNAAADIHRGQTRRSVRVAAFDAETGKPLWRHSEAMILPLTLAANGKHVVYHDGRVVRSFDLHSGKSQWSSPPTGQQIVFRAQANPDQPGAEKSTIILAPQFAPTLILYEDIVAFAGGRQINVLSADDGHELWRAAYTPSNYSVPADLFGFAGQLWGPDPKMNLWRPMSDDLIFNAYDLQTGAVKKHVKGSYRFRFQHHRCHQMKVVGNTILAGRAGVEFVDTQSGKVTTHHWLRGSCYFGVMPANGRLYVPPHNCACYVRAKLSGFFALNSTPPSRSSSIPEDHRLVHGPAYGQTEADSPTANSKDWPTYRHDAARSGRSGTRVSSKLRIGWQRPLGGRLTSPVIAENRAYVASTDAHTLYAVNAETGKLLWQFTFDGRIDSPPTIYEGLVLCGVRDGTVIALRATDGSLVWRFQACPEKRLIVSHGQLESVWPVSGSVLVVNKLVYFAAGRSSYLDGGIRLFGLEPHTGRTVVETVLSSRQPDGSERLDDQGVEGFLNDILSSDGKNLFMRHRVFDLNGNPKPERIAHLHGSDGYFSSDTTSRLLWTYAPMYTTPHQGAFYDMRLSRVLFPSGRILVEDRDTIYGFGQNRYDRPTTEPGGQWALFAAVKKSDAPRNLSARAYLKLARTGKKPFVRYHWWKPLPIQVWAMVKTSNALFVAGPNGSASISKQALEGKAEAQLLAISPADGRVLSVTPLPSRPVWDGMVSAQGNLFIALANGQFLCLAPAASEPPRNTESSKSKKGISSISATPSLGSVAKLDLSPFAVWAIAASARR